MKFNSEYMALLHDYDTLSKHITENMPDNGIHLKSANTPIGVCQ